MPINLVKLIYDKIQRGAPTCADAFVHSVKGLGPYVANEQSLNHTYHLNFVQYYKLKN